MIEYIKYKISDYSGIDYQSHDTIDEAIEHKKEVIQNIMDGKYDNILEERQVFMSDWISTKSDIASLRKEEIENIELKRVYHTPSGIVKRAVTLLDDKTEKYSGIEITIKSDFPSENYTVKLGEKDDIMYVKGGIICGISPWGARGIPLRLYICICPDGGIIHRGWEWSNDMNYYLHTYDRREDVEVTPEMIDTVSGLFSGRIKFNGLKIAVGGTVQKICPINVKAEEEKIGQTIYLA